MKYPPTSCCPPVLLLAGLFHEWYLGSGASLGVGTDNEGWKTAPVLIIMLLPMLFFGELPMRVKGEETD